MVQGFGGGGRQRVHIRNVHSLMSLLPLCYSTHKSSFCEEERVQRWPSFSLSSSTGGENGCVPKDFNQKHAGCRETSGVFCCERGAGCRVRGSGLWWRLRRDQGLRSQLFWHSLSHMRRFSPLRMTKRGDARRSVDRRFSSYRQPSPRGEGAPKGRIGHRRYERERERASQVRRL